MAYILINIVIFGAQISYIEKNQEAARMVIMVCGSFLFVLDSLMAIKFNNITPKFIKLFVPSGSRCKVVVLHLSILVFCFLFISRAFSEDFLRSGTQILFWTTGVYYDLFAELSEKA